MNKRHALLIALVLGITAVLGAYAALRTTHLGAASRNAVAAQLARREQRLTAAEARLKRELAHHPNAAALPAVAPRQQKVVYVRPAPIVIHKHRAGEHDDGGDGGGGDNGD